MSLFLSTTMTVRQMLFKWSTKKKRQRQREGLKIGKYWFSQEHSAETNEHLTFIPPLRCPAADQHRRRRDASIGPAEACTWKASLASLEQFKWVLDCAHRRVVFVHPQPILTVWVSPCSEFICSSDIRSSTTPSSICRLSNNQSERVHLHFNDCISTLKTKPLLKRITHARAVENFRCLKCLSYRNWFRILFSRCWHVSLCIRLLLPLRFLFTHSFFSLNLQATVTYVLSRDRDTSDERRTFEK